MGVVKRYKWVIMLGSVLIVTVIINPQFGQRAAWLVGSYFAEMLKVLPPIFLILGLLDVWVPKEVMIRLMGEGSGVRGGILAFILGSAAAGPLYAAFPVAELLLRKEAALVNVFIFIGAWSTTKLPMILFETSFLGAGFSVTRLLLNIPAIIIIALATWKVCSQQVLKTNFSEKDRSPS